MATNPVLVAIFWPEIPFFGDESRSRRHFEEKRALFWRRALISSPF
ncbi:hypothetical protein B4166_3329 [Caldibacillus thermoamylovorans]|nr:hypothetical protein B4166_3329 [Caldibacillus thermoamylovorans]